MLGIIVSVDSYDLIELRIYFSRPSDFKVFVKWPGVILMGLPLKVTCPFSLAAFNTLSLFYVFNVLTMLCYGEFMFWSFLFRILYASCTWISISFSSCWNFSDFIDNIFCAISMVVFYALNLKTRSFGVS